jgi:predicted nucleic acid-binding Zn ribbon protein
MSRKRNKTAFPVGSVLDEALAAAGLKAAFSRHRVVAIWPRIVSSAVARHAVAEKVVGPVLHVAVDSSVWMNELAAIKIVLLEKVNAALDPAAAPITDIRFYQSSRVGRTKAAPPISAPPPLSEDDLAKVSKSLEGVKDEELKAILRRIMEWDLQLKHQRKPADS